MVFEKIKQILVEQLDLNANDITMDSVMTDDLGADSLDLVDLLMSVEDEFDIEVPDEDIEKVKSVGDLVRYIEDHQ